MKKESKRTIPESKAEQERNKKNKIVTQIGRNDDNKKSIKNINSNEEKIITGANLPTSLFKNSEIKNINDKSSDDINISLIQALNRQTTLNTLRKNLLIYLTNFLPIEDMFTLSKMNKKFRSIIQNNKLFKKFMSLKKVSKKIINPETDMFEKDCEFLDKIKSNLDVKEISKYESENLLQCFFASIAKREICIKKPTTKTISYLTSILTSPFCKTELLDLTIIYSLDASEDIIEFSIEGMTNIILKNKSLKVLSLECSEAEKLVPFFISLPQNNNLKQLHLDLYFSNDNLFIENIPTLYICLNENKSINHLSLSYGDGDVKDTELDNYISNNKTITRLTFSCCLNKRSHFPFQALKNNNTIQVLEFTGGTYNSAFFKYLAIDLNQRLEQEKVQVLQYGLGTKQTTGTNILSSITKTDPMNTSIHTLIFRDLRFQPDSCFSETIAYIINTNQSITKLDISSNEFSSSLDPLFRALKSNTSLKSLIMKRNKFERNTKIKIDSLIDSLMENRTLTEINLKDSSIDFDVKKIEKMMEINPAINIFNLTTTESSNQRQYYRHYSRNNELKTINDILFGRLLNNP